MTRELVLAFVIGLVVGWLIELIWDWLFWRSRAAAVRNQALRLEQTVNRQNDELFEARRQAAEAGARADALAAQVADLERRLGAAARAADDLTAIKGIGRVFAERLHSAGITTFAALAQLSAAQLEAIIQPEAWQEVDFDSWIAQAAQTAGEA